MKNKKPISNVVNRIEEGYFIEKAKLSSFKKKLNLIFENQSAETPYNQTIYFNNKDHEVPFHFSIRARRYVSRPTGKTFSPSLNDLWKFEIKETLHHSSRKRKKHGQSMKLKEIIERLKKKSSLPFPVLRPLVPYVGATYKRKHYHPVDNAAFRVTIDTDLKYYIFSKSRKGIQKNKGDVIRIELKFPQELVDSKTHKEIVKTIKDLGGDRPVSKKQFAYNIEYRILKSKYKKWPVSPNTEIESKLSLSPNDQHVFNLVKEDFRNGKVKDFRLIKNYDYSWEFTAAARFVVTPDNSHIRINNESKMAVYKTAPVVMKNSFGLDCIIHRTELKEKAPDYLLKKKSTERRRTRKTFIMENKKSKLMYIVLIDRTSTAGKDLYQLEVEHICRSPTENEVDVIVNDIAFVTNYILKKYKKLKSTTLTKQEWVNKVNS